MRPQKFHGRYDSKGRPCAAPGCGAPGEFRAPSERRPSFDGPGARASEIRGRAQARQASREEFARFTPREREALSVMGLGPQTDRHELRKRYSALVRRYHPDRNGGNRSHEALLQRVVEAYQLLRKAAAFA